MILPDVNVLVYAFRADDPLHGVARAWLNDVVASDSRFALSKLALSAVVRIATDPRGHRNPASARGKHSASATTCLPNRTARSSSRGNVIGIFSSSFASRPTRAGADITDTWFAALAIEWGCEWVTFDRDFLKFPELKCTILQG